MIAAMSACIDISGPPFTSHMAIECGRGNTPGHSGRTLSLLAKNGKPSGTKEMPVAFICAYRTTHADTGVLCGAKSVHVQPAK